jgi:glc operon protein GlcG
MMRPLPLIALAAIFGAVPLAVRAQQPAPMPSPQMMLPYGPITLAQARKIAAGAEAEAVKNKWPVVICVVDSGAHLVLLERLDDTQLGSVDVAQDKARSAVLFRRPTKSFQDSLAAGGDGARVLKLPGAMPVEGGVPLVREGRIIGAIGVSGVTSAQDGVVAAAGAAAIK